MLADGVGVALRVAGRRRERERGEERKREKDNARKRDNAKVRPEGSTQAPLTWLSIILPPLPHTPLARPLPDVSIVRLVQLPSLLTPRDAKENVSLSVSPPSALLFMRPCQKLIQDFSFIPLYTPYAATALIPPFLSFS